MRRLIFYIRISEIFSRPADIELTWAKVSITPWSTVLIEKLIRRQLAKQFPAFYATRWFITELTSARHLFLS